MKENSDVGWLTTNDKKTITYPNSSPLSKSFFSLFFLWCQSKMTHSKNSPFQMIFTIIYNNKKTADRFNQQCSLCQNTVLYCRRSPDGKNLICFVGLADARFVNYLLKQYKPERSKYPRYLYIYLKNIKNTNKLHLDVYNEHVHNEQVSSAVKHCTRYQSI